jgi:PAS domain S-box-containing protein
LKTNQHKRLASVRPFDEIAGVALRDSVPYSLFEQVVEQGSLGFSTVDPKSGEIIFANPKFCEMIGYTLDELIEGKVTLRDLTHPDDLERCTSTLRLLVTGEVDWCTIEKRYIQKDKSVVQARATGARLTGCGDRSELTLGVIIAPADANEIPRRSDQSKEVSFWTKDFKSKAETCSQGLKILLGLPPDGPTPSFEEFIARAHPEDRSRIIEEAGRVAKGMFRTSEHRIIRPSGEIRWVSQSAKPVFNDAGEVVGMVGTCIDITDERREPKNSRSADTVKIARQYVDEHWDQPLNVAALAEAANVNVRTLFKHCKANGGFTPNQYIKRVRLNHARAMLQAADPSATIVGIALKCCFQNQGHFARDYRLAFGERPSETLERARRGISALRAPTRPSPSPDLGQ